MNGIPISEAAKQLGMTVEATRMRVRRGTIPSHKGEDGRWYVDLDGVQGDVQGADLNMGEPVQGDVQPPPIVSDATIQAMIVMQRQMDILAKQLEVKDSQLGVKDAQLAEAATERAELRRLLGNAQQTVQMLTAGGSDPPLGRERSADDHSPVQPVPVAHDGGQRDPQAVEAAWLVRLRHFFLGRE